MSQEPIPGLGMGGDSSGLFASFNNVSVPKSALASSSILSSSSTTDSTLSVIPGTQPGSNGDNDDTWMRFIPQSSDDIKEEEKKEEKEDEDEEEEEEEEEEEDEEDDGDDDDDNEEENKEEEKEEKEKTKEEDKEEEEEKEKDEEEEVESEESSNEKQETVNTQEGEGIWKRPCMLLLSLLIIQLVVMPFVVISALQ